VFTDGEKGITATKLNNIVGQSAIQTDFFANKPAGSALNPTDQLLELTSGGTYARITGQNVIDSVSANLNPTIWNVRLRSYNSIGNPNWEITQRNAGTSLTNPADNVFVEDRWTIRNGAAIQCTVVRTGGNVYVPGTTFLLSGAFPRVTLTTQKTSLAVGDLLGFQQTIEGAYWRELSKDVHSVSLLVRSSVANLTFGLALRDPGGTRSLTKLCTLGAANTFTLITLPNLPVWDAGGTFTAAIGSAGYILTITLASGTTWMNSANDVWVASNAVGALGQANFAASPVNSTFDFCFCQHEPGAQSSTLQDLPFDSNLLACWRYFQKTYDFATKPGTVTQNGAAGNVIVAGSQPRIAMPFRRTMAKAPTVLGYSPATGASANVRDVSAAADKAITAYLNVGEAGFNGCTITSPNAAVYAMEMHYTADTGW